MATYAYWAVLLGAFVTSFYSFRLLYLTFFGKERFDDGHAHHDAHHHDEHHGHHGGKPHESPWVVTLPLILLAIPSIFIGYLTVGPMLFGKDIAGNPLGHSFFDGIIYVSQARDVVMKVGEELYHGSAKFAIHGFMAPAFWLTLAGFLLATLMYIWKPDLPAKAAKVFALPIKVLQNKYWMDDLWIKGFAGGSLMLGKLFRKNDEKIVDGLFVNGSARFVDLFSSVLRRTQSGYLYHYAFAMILGLIALLALLIDWNAA